MASIVNWFKKHIEQPVEHFVSNDVAQPVAHAVSNVGHAAGNVVHAAAPSTIENRVVQPVVQHVAKPIFNFPQTVNNDVFKPGVNLASRAIDQVNPFDNGLTFKQRTPAQNRSLFGQVTHNGFTNVAGGAVKFIPQFSADYANTFANLGNRASGRPNATIQQNLNDPFSRNIVKMSGATGTNRQLLGSGVQVGLSALPGTGKLAEGAIRSVAPAVPRLVAKVAANTATAAPLGAGFNEANLIGSNQPLTKQNLLSTGKAGFEAGGALGLAGTVAPTLVKTGIKVAKNPGIIKEVPTQVNRAVNPMGAQINDHIAMLEQSKQGKSLTAQKQIDKAIAATIKERARINQKGSVGGEGLQLPTPEGGNIRPVPARTGGAARTDTNQIVPSRNASEALPTRPNQSSQKISMQSLPAQPGRIEMPAPRQTGVSSDNNTLLPATLPVIGKARTSQSKLLKSKNIRPEVKQALDPNYQSHSFTAQREAAAKAVAKNLAKSTDTANRLIAKDAGTMTDAEHHFVSAVAAAQDAKGTKMGQQLAESLYGGILRHRTATGQAFAAFREMANDPNILKAQAVNFLKNKNIELKPEERTHLNGLIKTLRGTQLGTPERDYALHNVISFVTNKVPSSTGDKVVNFWRAGLLTSPITTGGNILGNTGEAVVRNAFVNPVATAADVLQSLVTGKRTKTLAGGQIRGGAQGAKQARQYIRTGFDPTNPLTKFEGKGDVHYGNGKIGKITGTYVNSVYRGLGAQDKPFRQAATRQAQLDLAKADAKNLKLSGQARQDYINKAVNDSNWQPKTFTTAKDSRAAGAFAVFGNETVLGRVAQKIKEPITIGGRTYSGAIRQFILPFTQVPASIAMRIAQRSDLGATEIINQILRIRKGLPYDQRAVSEAIGNGTFGPAAIFAGYALSRAGQITGNYPTDPKERALWKSEDKQANSVKVGNRWYSLNYMQPFGTLLGIGDQMHQDVKTGSSPVQIISNASGRAAKSVESQSFLQGIDGLLSAVNDPQRSAKQYINSTASSIVPNIIKTTARATDPLQRTTGNALDALKGTIPGIRENLPAAQDMFGTNLKAVDNPLNQLFNPLRPTIAKTTDPVVNELQRLQDTQNGIIPTSFDKSTFAGKDGKGPKLTDSQVRQLNSLVNSKVKATWGNIIADPRYKTLSDEDKNTVLKQAKDKIASAYKRQFMADNNIPITKAPTASDVSILSNSQPDYLANKTTSQALYTTPDAEYNAYKAKYDQNIKDNKYNAAQKITATKTLRKLEVGKVYPKDVRDLYGLSKADLSSYLSTKEKGVDKAKIAEQLIAYDQALYNAGLEASPKYKNGIAPSKSGRSSSSNAAARAAFHAEMAKFKSPLKIVGALPAPSVASVPKFKTPALRTVYQKKGVNTHPTSSLTKTKR